MFAACSHQITAKDYVTFLPVQAMHMAASQHKPCAGMQMAFDLGRDHENIQYC